MIKKCMAAVAITILMSWAVMAQDARTVISNASKAVGADNLKTIEYSGSGMDFTLGQAYNPSSPWPKFINKTYTRVINFETPATRMDRIRMQGENPPRGGGQQPVIGEQPQNQTVIVNANTPWVNQLEIWMTPYGFLKAAAANNATVKQQTTGGKRYNVITFQGQNKAAVNGYINEQNMVERVETMIDNTMLGDIVFEALYSDYKDFGGVKFPTKMVQKQGGYPILDLTITDVKPNAPANIQNPQRGAGAAAAAAPAAAAPSQKLADGVYLILGGYASIAVDFKDYIVVVEGPQSEERASAIITEAKRLIPNKPIKYVVNTHQHFDHAGGLRTFVAEGATVITHQVNKPYYEKLFNAPHTLTPDKLASAKKKASIETMTEKKVLTDGNHVIELHHLQGSGHNEGLVVAYFPKEKILLEADAFNPPAQPVTQTPATISPYNQNLVDNIARLKLDVQTIIPVHYPADGRKVSITELMKVVGKASSN